MYGIEHFSAFGHNARVVVPVSNEAVIQRLCQKVLASDNEGDRVVATRELRAAIHEHLRLAKQSLEARAFIITILENRITTLENRAKERDARQKSAD